MWMKGKSVDRPCIRIQRGEIISMCSKICTTREGERGRDRVGERERGGSGMVLEGGEGKRVVLFAIRPFLFYTVPKKNKRTNTFLNKGRALEVEARWGCEVAPLWVTTE